MAILVSDVINRAFITMGVIAPGETLPTVIRDDAFQALNNGVLDMLSAEGLTVPNQVMQTFNLSANQAAYTLGSGGTFATTGGLRALKVTAWRARYQSEMERGGPALAMDLFARQAADLQRARTGANIRGLMQAMEGAVSSFLASPVPPVYSEIQNTLTSLLSAIPNTLSDPIPTLLGADTNYPLINIRISPPPGGVVGSIELAYLTPITNFATVGDALTLPQGWFAILQTYLAKFLSPTYAKPSMIQLIWQLAAEAKKALLQENAMPEAPQQPATQTATPPEQVQSEK